MLYVSIDKFLTKKIRVLRKKSNFKWTAKKLSIVSVELGIFLAMILMREKNVGKPPGKFDPVLA